MSYPIPVQAAIRHLAIELGITEDEVMMLTYKKVEWDGLNLGVPGTKGFPTGAAFRGDKKTGGYMVHLAAYNKTYRYHTDDEEFVVFVGHPET